MIDEFTDVNDGEKELMKLWNLHMMKNRLEKSKMSGKTITLKIKYSDFVTQTRSKTIPYYTSDISLILEVAKELLFQDELKNSVRLLGISLSNFKNPTEKKKVEAQLKLSF